MKQTILGTDAKSYASRLKKRKLTAVAVAVIMVGLNVLFCLLRNENNHYLMLGLNIAVDILGLWFLIAFISFKIVPQGNLVRLYGKSRTEFDCVITAVSEGTTRVQGFDCFEITAEGKSNRTLFLPDTGTISLNAGDKVRVSAISGIIAEVDHE